MQSQTLHKLQIALDIFVIILVIILSIWIYFNWNWLHNATIDVCKACMEKTGANCYKPINFAQR